MEKRSGKRWTEKEKEQLEKLYKRGKSRREIATTLKRGAASIGAMLHRKRLTKRKEWTNEEVEQLKKLHFEGKTTTNISNVLDRSRYSVDVKKKQLNLISPSDEEGRDNERNALKYILKNQVKGGFLTQEEADRIIESRSQQNKK